MSTENDIREIRSDVKALMQSVATLSNEVGHVKDSLDEHARPCKDFTQHLEQHKERRSGLIWVISQLLAPALATAGTYLAMLLGMQKNP